MARALNSVLMIAVLLLPIGTETVAQRPSAPQPKKGDFLIVTADSAKVMAADKAVAQVVKGQRFTVHDADGRGVAVIARGKYGWISPQNASLDSVGDLKQLFALKAKYFEQYVAFARAGRIEDAVAITEQTAQIARMILSSAERSIPDATDTLKTLREQLRLPLDYLARNYDEREDYTAAVVARQELLSLAEKSFGAKHWKTTDERIALKHSQILKTMNQDQMQRFRQAGQLNHEAVELLDGDEGKVRQALEKLRATYSILREILGESHLGTLTSLHNLACASEKLGDLASARGKLREGPCREGAGVRHGASSVYLYGGQIHPMPCTGGRLG